MVHFVHTSDTVSATLLSLRQLHVYCSCKMLFLNKCFKIVELFFKVTCSTEKNVWKLSELNQNWWVSPHMKQFSHLWEKFKTGLIKYSLQNKWYYSETSVDIKPYQSLWLTCPPPPLDLLMQFLIGVEPDILASWFPGDPLASHDIYWALFSDLYAIVAIIDGFSMCWDEKRFPNKALWRRKLLSPPMGTIVRASVPESLLNICHRFFIEN